MANAWSPAEKGGSVPGCLVLSGHHVGGGLFGDNNGKVPWEALQSMSHAMPKAAAQVEDLHMSACYSGGDQLKNMYKDMFPNLKTVWAYGESAPGSGSGAVQHLKAWEKTTRADGVGVDDTAAALVKGKVRKAENIDATNLTKEAKALPDLGKLKTDVAEKKDVFGRYFSGDFAVKNPGTGPLRDYYGQVQKLLQHPGLTGAERKEAEGRRDQTIRTLFYSTNVGPKSTAENKASIEAGYKALGVPVPDFGKLTRREGMDSIAMFRSRMEFTNPKPAAAQDLLPKLNGLWNLDPAVIPERWI
jgi:hypothetical protein